MIGSSTRPVSSAGAAGPSVGAPALQKHASCTTPELSLRTVTARGSLEVSWSVPPSAHTSPRDWVALYIHDRQWKYEHWAYTNGAHEGSARFDGLGPGFYDARLFLCGAGPAAPSAKSGPALVGSEVPVTATHSGRKLLVSWPETPDSSPADWIAVFPCGTRSNKQYIEFAYASSATGVGTREITLDAPRAPGAYEARFFFASAKYSFSGKSRPVVVSSADGLSIDPASEFPMMRIRWMCSSKRPAPRSDWIGLFEPGADSHKYIAAKYTCEGSFDAEAESGTLVFDLSKTHPRVRDNTEYEFRYFSGEAKYTPMMSAKLVLTHSPIRF